MLVLVNKKRAIDEEKIKKQNEEATRILIEFKRMKRTYRNLCESTVIDEVSRNSTLILGYLTDIKEMITDQADIIDNQIINKEVHLTLTIL